MRISASDDDTTASHMQDSLQRPPMTPSLRSPRLRLASILRRHRSFFLELAFVCSCVAIYSVICGLAPVNPHVAFANGQDILTLERILRISWEPALNEWLTKQPLLTDIFSTYYAVSFFLVTAATLIIVWVRRPDRYIYVRNSLLVMTAGAAVTYWLYPVAPPRLLDGANFVDSVAESSGFGSTYSQMFSVFANPYGAMPSMHTGWALWAVFALGTFVYRRWWQRLLLALHPVATVMIILMTGNHYLLDAVAAVGYFAAGAVLATALASSRIPVLSNKPQSLGTVHPQKASTAIR
ncbi:phosphatase PAP2 family protein [Schaalia sp. ZJ405]|uniref:phosphatase PAP2 family protein n=1 Tax=Schaalia sp. ZJ405 TaxID=2709403 RepID=UPI001E590953|nr:phosphatase PAP2 family protein [Schaalia sp. ZJ405]